MTIFNIIGVVCLVWWLNAVAKAPLPPNNLGFMHSILYIIDQNKHAILVGFFGALLIFF